MADTVPLSLVLAWRMARAPLESPWREECAHFIC